MFDWVLNTTLIHYSVLTLKSMLSFRLLSFGFSLKETLTLLSMLVKTIRLAPVKYSNGTRASWIFKWEHSKHSKYSKNSCNKCLAWSNKDRKGFSKKLQTKQTLCKNFSQHCLASPLKNSHKNEKCSFQRLRTYVFEFKVAWKLFSKTVRMTKFWFKQFLMFCLTFPQNGFNFDT